ncbi:N-acetylmuramoyl-L-alanine amidase [Dysgonomonas sp. ZJ279]|uniref:N-acetylmuramoyl-L-alanine amidase n=1 Tax=Dysgonomonas sp. ZJ279 TaxID=2709796 RepID=UPI0013EB9B1C|nr:N-acetylmuramoyl-L-alanine amidase [Dysgonomonas sp. ZJ279]
MRKIDKIILHCSATKEGQDFKVADIDKWHKAQGWAGIGYHYVIYLDGTIHEGRNENEIGAHVQGHNSNSIGVCYIGGVDAKGNPKDTRTDVQKVALIALVEELKEKYPNATIHGHNEFAAKACPSFDVRKEFRQ